MNSFFFVYVTDTHHKLIRWKFVIHAGIDGYSRLITYMKCAGNNRATTMYRLCISAVEQYHLPSRVRSDQGGEENILVAQHMIEQRGAERNSMITVHLCTINESRDCGEICIAV